MDKELQKEIVDFIVEAANQIGSLHEKYAMLADLHSESVKTIQYMLLRISVLEVENEKLKKELEQISLLN